MPPYETTWSASSATTRAQARLIANIDDGRARLVRLTDRGLGLLPVARAEEARIDAEWEKHLGSRRMGQLRHALGRLREIVDP